MKKLFAVLAVALCLPAMALTVPMTISGATYGYTGATGEDPENYLTWTIMASSLTNHNFVIDDYPGCPTELTEPELCPAHYLEWQVEQVHNHPDYASYDCNHNSCGERLQQACETANLTAWLLEGGELGHGSCNPATYWSRNLGTDAYQCYCRCQGDNLGQSQRLTISSCVGGYSPGE